MLLLVTLKAPTFPYNSGLSFCALMPVILGLHCTSKLKLLIIASGGQKAGKKEGRGGGVFFLRWPLLIVTNTQVPWTVGCLVEESSSLKVNHVASEEDLTDYQPMLVWTWLMVWVLSWYRLSVMVFTERCLTLHHAPVALFGVVFFVFAYPLSCTLSVRTVKCAVCMHCYWWSLASPSGHCKIRWCSCQSCWLRFAKYACLQQVFPSA